MKALTKSGIRAAFHNALLSLDKRRELEKKFDDITSGLNVLVATSTLSTGINLA